MICASCLGPITLRRRQLFVVSETLRFSWGSEFLHFVTMIAAKSVTATKLKIKFSSKRIEVDLGKRSHETGQQLSASNGLGHNSSLSENSHSQLKQKSSMPSNNKRGPSAAIEIQQSKRQKMDRGVTQQCSNLLKDLMGHPHGWVFNQPVDPKKLNIPDYFTIIKNPMDLGTVKSKLNKNLYGRTEDFAADIRLTFSNAMLYNPPVNVVHKMAKELNHLFDTWWKSLEEKCNHERSKFGSGKVPIGRTKEISVTHKGCPKTPPLHSAGLPKRSKPSEEEFIKSSFDVQAIKVKIAKPAENGKSKSLQQKFHKGTDSGGKLVSGSVNKKASLSPVACKFGTCGRSECRCSLPCDSAHTSSDISSERSLNRDHHACSIDTSILGSKVKGMPTSELSKSDPDSDVALSALDDDNTCPSSQLTTPATDATSGRGWQPSAFDVPLSPSKALRAAILKYRKAQHKTRLDTGDKTDPMKLQQEKERLERKQREEKSRIEAEIRAAEAASRCREELELKQQREREREAARVALQKMERTVDLDRNLEVLKELEMLCGCPLSYSIHCGGQGPKGIDGGSPLERLGLFIKVELGDDGEDGDGEEGEILP